MGIEKLSNNGGMSYQGSATGTAVSSTPSVEPVVQSTGTVTQAVGTAKREFSQNAQRDQAGSEELSSINQKKIKSAMNDLNKQLKNSEAVFGIHEKTNRVTIKIIDKTTKEVIKEYPPEQTLDMIAKVWEIAGILVDEKR